MRLISYVAKNLEATKKERAFSSERWKSSVKKMFPSENDAMDIINYKEVVTVSKQPCYKTKQPWSKFKGPRSRIGSIERHIRPKGGQLQQSPMDNTLADAGFKGMSTQNLCSVFISNTPTVVYAPVLSKKKTTQTSMNYFL